MILDKHYRDYRCLRNLYIPPNSSHILEVLERKALERKLLKNNLK